MKIKCNSGYNPIDYCRKKGFLFRGRLILSVLVFQFLAVSAFGQSAKLTLHLHNQQLVTAIEAIESQSDYHFFYNAKLIGMKQMVSIDSDNEDIAPVLDRLFRNTGIVYRIKGTDIILSQATAEESGKASSPRKITGRITDEKGEPIVGAVVRLKDAMQGTTSGLEGRYTLQVSEPEPTLIVSYIGYQTVEQTLSRSQSMANITLKSESKEIEDVVVVGYGVMRKRDVSTSIASVRAEELQDVPATSIEQVLAGRMAGVQVTQPNATPGAGMNIKVRGVGTITAGSNPLYVVDGVPLDDDSGGATGINISPISMLDMNDIESIEVLKDASSAAIYGSRGSNGVVLITTKSGRKQDGKPEVKFEAYVGVQNMTDKIDVLDAYEYSQLVYDAHNATYYGELANAGKTHLYNPSASNQERWDALGKTGSISTNQAWMIPPEILPYIRGEKGLTNTDWQDAVTRTGLVQKYYLSVSGGNKNINYLFSGNYRNEEGIVIGSDFERFGMRGKVNTSYKRFKGGININIDRSVYDLVNTEGRYSDDGVLSAALGAAPIYPVRNPDGEFNYEHFDISYGNTKIPNPVAIASLIDDRMVSLRMVGNVYLQYELAKGLNFKTSYGVNYNNYVRNSYRPAALPTSQHRMPPSIPEATSRLKNKFTWVWENTLNFNRKFGKHRIDAVAAWTAQRFNMQANRITAVDLPRNDMLHTIPNTATPTSFDSSQTEWALLSGLARVQYNYDNRYMLSAAIRADGSSRFGRNNKWGYFPSVSAAWYITEENFLKSADWLSTLKLRASYGQTGNMSIGDYASFGIISNYGYAFGGITGSVGMAESNPGNPDIGWEKTSQVNVGLEVGFFSWLNFELDLYKGTTSDMLFEVPVQEYSGFSSMLKNIGKVENKGIELTVSTNNRFGEVRWTNSFNYSANRNKVLSLAPGVNQYITQSNKVIDFITKVGEPIGNYYTYVTDGVYQNQAEIDADVANGLIVPGAQPGDFRFKKLGTDDTINDDDKTITGNYLPKFTYGYSTRLQWKWFDASVALQGVYGNQIANINRRYLANMEGNANQLSVVLDRWKSPDDPGSGQVYRANRKATGMNAQISTWHIEDGSYCRIREITIGYTFSKRLISKIGMTKARIYLSAFNPFTFSEYSGYNPEVSQDSNPLHQGVDYGTYPLAKTFVFGVNLTF